MNCFVKVQKKHLKRLMNLMHPAGLPFSRLPEAIRKGPKYKRSKICKYRSAKSVRRFSFTIPITALKLRKGTLHPS